MGAEKSRASFLTFIFLPPFFCLNPRISRVLRHSSLSIFIASWESTSSAPGAKALLWTSYPPSG